MNANQSIFFLHQLGEKEWDVWPAHTHRNSPFPDFHADILRMYFLSTWDCLLLISTSALLISSLLKKVGIRIVITMSPMALPVISPHEDSCNVTLNAFKLYGNLCKNNQLLAIYSGREYCGETFIIVFKYIMGSFAEYGNQWFFIIPKFQLREMR